MKSSILGENESLIVQSVAARAGSLIPAARAIKVPEILD